MKLLQYQKRWLHLEMHVCIASQLYKLRKIEMQNALNEKLHKQDADNSTKCMVATTHVTATEMKTKAFICVANVYFFLYASC